MNAAQHKIYLKHYENFLIMCCSVFCVWPKTTRLLPVWPRDAKRSDSPCHYTPRKSFCNKFHFLTATALNQPHPLYSPLLHHRQPGFLFCWLMEIKNSCPAFGWFKNESLAFKSLIHFEFILVCGIRRWSRFIFLNISVQFFQHHLLNKPSLARCMCLPHLSNINRL